MIWWDKKFLALLESANLSVRFYKRFVDDGNIKLKALDSGAQWDSSTMQVIYRDAIDERQPDKRTADVVKEIADSVTEMLVWTTDFPSANSSGRLPILDIETWCVETEEGTKTYYSFYRKPMANPVSIPARSAVSDSVKFSTYRQEVCRILKNTSIDLPWSHKAGLLSEFSWRLRVSGYSESFRSKILAEGMAGYVNTLKTRLDTGIQFNRPKEVIRMARRKPTASNWFCNAQSTYDAVLFVPPTPQSKLAKLLQEHEVLNNQGRSSRIKIVERAGRPLKNVLAPNDPWGVSKCQDQECFPCSSSVGSPKLSCRTPGILYRIVCSVCEDSGKKVVYFGESGQNGYSRGRKHLQDFKSGMTSHCMTIHMKVHHPNLPRSASYFKMIPVKSFRSPLERQVSEALSINNAEVDLVMNSGSEWRCGRLPRAAVTRPLT